jgi:hypothetical protein
MIQFIISLEKASFDLLFLFYPSIFSFENKSNYIPFWSTLSINKLNEKTLHFSFTNWAKPTF